MAQRETQVKKRAAKRKKSNAKKALLKQVARRKGLQQEFENLLALQDAKIKTLAKTIQTIWNNQVELTKSIDRVEEEFCVLGRLVIPKMNEILIALGSEELITEEVINSVFLTWHEFKQRPDFKNHFVPWFLGVPLQELPPPPEIKEEVATPNDAPALEGGDADEFGGDYAEGKADDLGNETTEEGRPPSDEGSEEDALPEGQDVDSPVPGDERSGSAEVPEVPDRV